MSFLNPEKESPNYTIVFAVLSTLFFMWGLITVTNIMLANDLRTVFQLSYVEAISMNFLFFATYFVMAVPSGKLIDKIGYRKGMMTGLGLAAAGCFLAYPATGMRSYSFFMTALFIQATGITILQVAANPYVALLGSRGRGASKLTLVQAFNSLGAFVATLFASGFLMELSGLNERSYFDMSPEEIRNSVVHFVQLPFVLLGVVLLLLGIFLFFSRLPKINTKEIEPLVLESNPPRTQVWQFSHAGLGALAIFAYVGAEVTIGTYLASAASELAVLYWGGAMVGRFVGSALLVKVSPRKSIGIFSIIASLLVIGFMLIDTQISIYAIVAVGLFNSVLFPCIFTMGIDGLGKFSEEGSAMLIMAIVGGAIIPFVSHALIEGKAGFILPVLCYIFIAYFGLKGSRYPKRTNFY